jgi:hypothetical protein
MIATHQDTGINDRDAGMAISYNTFERATPDGFENDFLPDQDFFSYSKEKHEETKKELKAYYSSIYITGEFERSDITQGAKVVELLKSSINLINEVLEAFDDEIERINTFSLFNERIKSIWELREDANNNFVEILVLLEVAARNSHYQNYEKKQYNSIKMVLEKIKEVYITSQEAKECRKILMDSGIDLFAPIRNWENYTIEIKKNDATK